MSLEGIFGDGVGAWMDGTGPESEVVISSRVRLARNIERFPFPHLLSPGQGEKIVQMVGSATNLVNRSGEFGSLEMVELNRISLLDRRVLVEKHLISPQHAKDGRHKAVVLRADAVISIMVNEEDHLRIQCLASGLRPEESWRQANALDDALEHGLDYAFSERRGYLTACPTNAGTGLRASVMVHLPALVITNQIGRIFTTVGQLGLVVRGLYGEGTEAVGNMFQISNQISLGQSEEEIIRNLKAVTRQVMDQERAARHLLLKEAREQIADRVGRAYGALAYARVMNSQEAMRLFSDVRLGIDLDMLPGVSPRTLNELMVITQPACLQKMAGEELSPFERDVRRAMLIRSRIKSIQDKQSNQRG